MTSKSRIEERQRLKAHIEEWNSNRLDLFALSQPNEDLEFFGVMRFFYQDEGEKVSTKCVRVSSTASTKDVMGILIEKFRPDMRMLSRANYALYEVHVNGEERQLRDNEFPLLVQLHWGKDDREGRFLLKKETDRTLLLDCTSTTDNQSIEGQTFSRKLSKREKKELKKKEKEQKVKGKENDKSVAEKLYNELPESSFTRSISNPELVMRKRRQLKLEKKLQQIRSNDGGPDSGGTLKIYGSAVNPDVPYKTLLLAVNDNVAHVVKETLEKYGMDRDDPDKFCLVQVMIPPDGPDFGKDPRERVLDDDECPLAILLQHPPSRGTIMFQLRPRPFDFPKQSKKKMPMISNRESRDESILSEQAPTAPLLLQINPDCSDVFHPVRHVLQTNATTEIGRENYNFGSNAQRIQLATQDILPQHCAVINSRGLSTLKPSSKEALVFLNGMRIHEPTILRHGMVVQFGKMHYFRFLDPSGNEKSRSTSSMAAELAAHQQQQHPLPSGGGGGGGAPKRGDFETTFDVDGHVETIPSSKQQQQMFAPDPRFGPPGYEADLLPAQLNFPDDAEDKLLACIANEASSPTLQFKMAPAYVFYMAVRSRASRIGHSDLSQNEHSWQIASIAGKISRIIHQRVQENQSNPMILSFWMANASELLHFFKRDADISPALLQAQNLLAEAVQMAFNCLVDFEQSDLAQTMPAFLSTQPDDANPDVSNRYQRTATVNDVLQVLSSAMTLLRRCRVNAALTIQLFSQLFHFINVWIFNRLTMEPRLQLCTRTWGQVLKRRLDQIQAWAEQQGLELAADCHLAKVLQATYLLESPKMMHDVSAILLNCENLNSLQIRRLLENYVAAPNEPPIRSDVIEQLIIGAENDVDEPMQNEGQEIRVDEPVSLQLPFLLPDDGYSCDFVKGVPNGMAEFLEPFVQKGLCRLSVNTHSRGTWMVYMTNTENLKSSGLQQQQSEMGRDARSGGGAAGGIGAMSQRMEPEIVMIQFSKVNNSLGLSIVAAKGEGQRDKSIYVKSVVSGGGAALDGRVLAGDQLLEVDGKSLIGISQEKAAEMMVKTGQVVNLKIAKQGAIFHGLATLIGQSSPKTGQGGAKQQKSTADAKTPQLVFEKSQVGSESNRTNPRPLSNYNDVRSTSSSSRPLNEQHEAKSTPVLNYPMSRDPVGGQAGAVNHPKQVVLPQMKPAQVESYPNRHASTSQPDLVNRRFEPDDFNQPGSYQGQLGSYQGQLNEMGRYGLPGTAGSGATAKMKGARTSPSTAVDTENQRVLEWQQRNQLLQEQERLKAVQQLEEEGFKKFEPSVAKQPVAVRPVAPVGYYQPQSNKGPGYAARMLFPSSSSSSSVTQPPASSSATKDGKLFYNQQQQGTPGNQGNFGMPGNQGTSNMPGYQGEVYRYNNNSSATLGYQSGASEGVGGGGAYLAPEQQRNYAETLPPVPPPQQQSSFPLPSQRYAPPAQGNLPPQPQENVCTNNIRKGSYPPEQDLPPPPSDQHLAQMNLTGPSAIPARPPNPSYYGGQQNNIHDNETKMSSSSTPMPYSVAAASAAANDPVRFPPSNQSASSDAGYRQKFLGYPAPGTTGSAYDGAQRTSVVSENYPATQRQDASQQIDDYKIPAQTKKPPPIPVKPKIVTTPTGNEAKPSFPIASSSSSWQRETNKNQLDDQIQMKRLDEIRRLENRPYLSTEEQNKLQRLRTEAEFERRAREASLDDSEDEEDTDASKASKIKNETIQQNKRQQENIAQPKQPEPTYAKIEKRLPIEDKNRIHAELQPSQRQNPQYPYGAVDRVPEFQNPADQMVQNRTMDYQKPPPGGIGPSGAVQDIRQSPYGQRYPEGDYPRSASQAEMDSGRVFPPPNPETTTMMTRSMPLPSSEVPPPTLMNQHNYSVSEQYRPPPNDAFRQSENLSSMSGDPFGQRTATVSALRQPEGGQMLMKKTVTFNDNIGVTEYTVNRSYGSTSSTDSSFPQSPETQPGSGAGGVETTEEVLRQQLMPSSYVASTAGRPSSQQPYSQLSQQPYLPPSQQPYSQLSQQPYSQATQQPYSSQPTQQPYLPPSQQPYSQPSQQPYSQPSQQPYSSQPSHQPYLPPSQQPYSQPSQQPYSQLTQQPYSSQPTQQPYIPQSQQPYSQQQQIRMADSYYPGNTFEPPSLNSGQSADNNNLQPYPMMYKTQQPAYQDPYSSEPQYLRQPPVKYPYQPQQPSYSQDSMYKSSPSILQQEQQLQQQRQRAPDALNEAGSASGVIGSQEVYRDPKDKMMMAARGQSAAGGAGGGQRSTPDRMIFHDKMSRFASETMEESTGTRTQRSMYTDSNSGMG